MWPLSTPVGVNGQPGLLYHFGLPFLPVASNKENISKYFSAVAKVPQEYYSDLESKSHRSITLTWRVRI